MTRAVLALLTSFVLFSVATDPYTLRRTAGDYVEWGPWWQMSLGIINLLLLVLLVLLIWRRNMRRSGQVLAAETLYNLAVTIGLVNRDGVGRFIQGIGAEEYLSFYLLALGVRVVMLFVIFDGFRADALIGSRVAQDDHPRADAQRSDRSVFREHPV